MAKTKHQKLIKYLDNLWKEIIKLRAGNKSELSGQEGILHCHHIVRKPNYALRFELDNGICLTRYEHFRGCHGEHEELYREKIKAIRGQDIYDRLRLMRNNTVDLQAVKIYLENKLKQLKNG